MPRKKTYKQKTHARKKSSRLKFRLAVFTRDDHKCLVCGSSSQLDVHLITEGAMLPGGGRVQENAISLCWRCRERAEAWHDHDATIDVNGYGPSDLYHLIGSSLTGAVNASKEAL